MANTGTSQTFLPAKFHNFILNGLFFIHKNKRVQFFYETRCSLRRLAMTVELGTGSRHIAFKRLLNVYLFRLNV